MRFVGKGHPTRRLPASGVVAVLLALTLIAGSNAAGGAQPRKKKETTTTIVPGLTLTKIVDKKVPRRIFMLTVDTAEAVTMDVALADDLLGAVEETSSIAARHGAVAAVYGDFGLTPRGPLHPFAEDGSLQKTSDLPGTLFALPANEGTPIIGRPDQSVTMLETDAGETWTIDRWNDDSPAPGEIVAYSDAGSVVEPPPGFACSAHLVPVGTPEPVSAGVARDYTVSLAACSTAPLATAGGVVLSAAPGTDEAIRILSLTAGEAVEITWSLGWPEIFDAIGGTPLLVADGDIVVDPCSSVFCLKNPRTGVGVTADGTILMVVVDGRQKKWSVGFSLTAFARFFQKRGAVWAMNLDGGGSSTMVVQGEVVNRPSDASGERSISSALLVLPGPDPGEVAAPSSGDGGSGARAALADPASIGGLLDALASGDLGSGERPLPRELVQLARRFRELG
jgi:hypothetical protein